MRVPAKLIGGRYDGDAGTMRVPKIPEFIWAFTCPNPQTCRQGIHWTIREVEAQAHASAELYAHTGFDGECDAMPVSVYVAAPDGTPMDFDLRQEPAHAA